MALRLVKILVSRMVLKLVKILVDIVMLGRTRPSSRYVQSEGKASGNGGA